MTALMDTGPFVAVFDPRDPFHSECTQRLAALDEAPVTTLPVLTEAFYFLNAASRGSDNLRALVASGNTTVHLPDNEEILRAFALMEIYRDLPMDFADASIIAAAENLRTRRVFTLDSDFSVYRIKRGHRHYPVDIV